MKRTPLRPSTKPLKRRYKAAVGSREQREAWRRKVCASGVCAMQKHSRVPCDGSLTGHHAVSQQAIKKRLRGDELASRLWDPRNGIPLCERHHSRHTLAVERIAAEAVPAKALQFARELGLDYLLVAA